MTKRSGVNSEKTNSLYSILHHLQDLSQLLISDKHELPNDILFHL